MFPDNMKLFLVRYSVETSIYMSDGPDQSFESSRIVFAKDEGEAEEKVRAIYPSREYSIYYHVNFIETTEAIM